MLGSHFLCGSEPIFFRRPCRTTPALPKPIGEGGHILICCFVGAPFGTGHGAGLLMLLLREQVSLIGVLEFLPGAFMPGQVIFFSVVLGTGPMRVSSKVTVLSRYLL